MPITYRGSQSLSSLVVTSTKGRRLRGGLRGHEDDNKGDIIHGLDGRRLLNSMGPSSARRRMGAT